MAWVVDKGLLKLRDEINMLAPHRSTASDGFIGDAAHAGTVSDHNPQHPAPPGNPDYQVDAGDFTHDPAHGADMGRISEAIRRSRDRRVSYVIFNRRIFSGPDGPAPFVWRPYTGTSDPHTNHMHVSVRDRTHDQDQDWVIIMLDPKDIAAIVEAVFDYPVTTLGTGPNGENETKPFRDLVKTPRYLQVKDLPAMEDRLAIKIANGPVGG